MKKWRIFISTYGVLWVLIVLSGTIFSCTSSSMEDAQAEETTQHFDRLSFELADFYQTMKTHVGIIQLYVGTSVRLDAFLRMAIYQNSNNPVAMVTLKRYKKELEENDACILSMVKIFIQKIDESCLMNQQKQELMEVFQEIVDIMEYEEIDKSDSDGMWR